MAQDSGPVDAESKELGCHSAPHDVSQLHTVILPLMPKQTRCPGSIAPEVNLMDQSF